MPLPWWTSQSKISTRSAPHSAIAWAAATATLLNRQKPIARSRSAWWPGGRSPQKANPPSASSRSVAWTAPPAECRAASQEPSLATVSTSIIPPPPAEKRLDRVDVGRRRGRARAARGSRRAPRPARARASRASDSASSIAVRRLAFSGCPPVSCGRSSDGARRALRSAQSTVRPRWRRTTVRRRGGRRRRRRPLLGADRRRGGRARRDGLPEAAQRELELLGAGRARGGDRPRRLARAARRGHDRGRARGLPPVRGRAARARPRASSGSSSGAASTSTAIPTSSLSLALEGGHSRRRIVHAGGAATGRRITERLAELAAARRADRGDRGDLRRRPLERRRALPRRDHDRGRLRARATILATGGAAALWARTTNPWGAIGAGPVMAHAAGAELADLELCQFHPTALAAPGTDADGQLVTEARARRGRDAARRGRRALHGRAGPARRGHPRGPRPDGARRHRPRRCSTCAS